MDLLKKLFGHRIEAKEVPAEQKNPGELPQQAEAPQPEVPQEEEPLFYDEEPAQEAPAARPAVTADMISDSIDNCKSLLPGFGLTAEETDRYATALTAMQQAIRGLHATQDVTELMDCLFRVYNSALPLIFGSGIPLEQQKALRTVNDAIKAIPSTVAAPIHIATLQLAILMETSLILSSRKVIADLGIEAQEYEQAERDLLKKSGAAETSKLTEIERITFDQYEQQLCSLRDQIESAERLITTYNQKIVSMKGSIHTIQLNPNAADVKDMQEELDRLREKMPGIAELADIVEKASLDAEKIRARTKAEIRELERKLEDTAFIADDALEAKMSRMLSEINAPAVQKETAAEAQKAEQTWTPDILTEE